MLVALAGWLELGAGRRATAEQRRSLAELVRLPFLSSSFIGDALPALPWMAVRPGAAGARALGSKAPAADSPARRASALPLSCPASETKTPQTPRRTSSRPRQSPTAGHPSPPHPLPQDVLTTRSLLASFQLAVASEATRARLVSEFAGHPGSPAGMRFFRWGAGAGLPAAGKV